MYNLPKIARFNQNVLSKYNVYNSVFLTLPFDEIEDTGALLPLFTKICEKGFEQSMSPHEIMEEFVDKYLAHAPEKEMIDLMFRFIQYVERQVVLFDAVEDAAFSEVNNLDGKGTLRNLKESAEASSKVPELIAALEKFKVRPVLTAHPTQFYPGSVLGIITDLTKAIHDDNLFEIRLLLSQLGKTPFIKKIKPTPFDEAVSLIWYLENVFYDTYGDISDYISQNILHKRSDNALLELGFWPGGDRDGNPFVTTQITLDVADRLRTSILKCYYRDIRKLKRKLTFANVEEKLTEIEQKIYRSVYYSKGEIFITRKDFVTEMNEIRKLVVDHNQSLYVEEIDNLLEKINLFGFHFATIDIRQNSAVHDMVFDEIFKFLKTENAPLLPIDFMDLENGAKLNIILNGNFKLTSDFSENEDVTKTLESVLAIEKIQERNGILGCNRYVISNNASAAHVLQVLAMFKLMDFEKAPVDIVPLFEIVDDLEAAHNIMEQLYTNEHYAAHLKQQRNKQTVMVGFSDGTKDGGYLMANWSIFRAKENITAISRKYGIEVIFFDGRGGPPSRGGGKTHKFYASLGSTIQNDEIQLTLQGQTISSNFGIDESCRYNVENLLTAGLLSKLEMVDNSFSGKEKEVMQNLAEIGYEAYLGFKNHPKFLPYLENMSTLKYYSKTNIGSRPSKRSQSDTLDFSALRAIPFVGSWSQLKQNVPGFYGVGTALEKFEKEGNWEDVEAIYKNSLFFRTLLENSAMSLAKSFFPLTSYMKDDPEYGEFWTMIFNESERSKRLLLKLSGQKTLMENYPAGKASIDVREKIVLPLLVIQQYSLLRIKKLEMEGNTELKEIYEKLVTRSLFGNTNASRNSA